MIAVEHMDYGTLRLVKGEIDVNLRKAHDLLGEFRENTEDSTHIKFCITMLHQVRGALQMLDFTWASALACAMEKVAIVMDEEPKNRTEWIYATLEKSITQLPEYLARLQAGEISPPAGFIPLLNDLRVACGGSVLSEAMVFSPGNTTSMLASPESKTTDNDPSGVRALAGRLRPVYQTGLLVWYRDIHNKSALRRLMEVLVQLQQASPDEGLWCAAGEIIKKISTGKLECNISVKLLLGQVERQIRRVMEAGPHDLILHPPTDLIKNLLYYIAVAETQADPASETEVMQEDGHESINHTLLDMAAKAVKDELSWAKRKLDDFAHSGGRHTQNELRAIMDVLRRVSGTLDMLGRWESRQKVRKQAGILDAMLGEAGILDDPRIMEVANALLYVESLLGDQKIPPKPASQEVIKDFVSGFQPMREEEYHELCRAVVREVMVDLTQVKDDIIAFAKETSQCDLLNPVPALMHRIIGALTMLSLRRPTIILKAIYHYVNHELLGVRAIPSKEALDTLADVMTSVEYFLETMIESQMNLDSLLDMAEGNITTLGYLVDGVDEMVIDADPSRVVDDEDIMVTEEEAIELSSPEGTLSVDEVAVIASPVTLERLAVDAFASSRQNVAVMDGQNEEVVEDILEIFVEEATEAMGMIRQYYPQWKNDTNDIESLKTFRRSFHTLKGSGRLVGANVVGELSWAVENLLNKIIENEVIASPAIFDYLEKCIEMMPGLIDEFQISRIQAEMDSDIRALIDKAETITSLTGAVLEPAQPMPVVENGEPLTLMTVQNTSVSMPVPEMIMLSDMAESMEVIEVVDETSFDPLDRDDEISGIDPVLLEIFTNESEGRLREIRDFIDICRKSKKNHVVESLLRNIHTLQGSAHMSGFMRIAELSDVFERHINSVLKLQREMTGDELSALDEFVNIVDSFLHLNHPLKKTPEALSTIDRHRALMSRMNGIVDDSHQSSELFEVPATETGLEIIPSEHADADKEHDSMVRQIFLEEAAEILENTESALHQWMHAPGAMEPMARLERELHTFKGGARMAGMVPMGDLSHSVESLLNAIVAGNIPATEEIIQLLQQSHDQLHHMLEQANNNVAVTPADKLVAGIEALTGHAASNNIPGIDNHQQDNAASGAELRRITEVGGLDDGPAVAGEISESIDLENAAQVDEHASAATAEPSLEREVIPEKPPKEQVRIKADILDNIVNQAGELSISRSRLEQQVTMLRSGLSDMKQTVDRLREKLRKLDIETEAQILFRYQEVSNQGEEFDPLEFDRFSLVQQLSRGMMESASDLMSIQDQFEKQVGDAEVLLLQQAHMSTELQETMMGTRLLPFSGVASRMKRLVRQISRETGKLIDLDVVGEDVDMDRIVLEKIIAPLEHMIRNAIDHGIENIEKRRQLGKPDKGAIKLHLAKEGVEIVIRMQDDGAGFNLQAIHRKAVERGLLAENVVVDDRTLIQFVLESGFSTAEKITQISGRGVGMDVVNSEIKQLGGSLGIESSLGQGSTFTIRLPVALSVARALIVKDRGQAYAILNSSIDGVMRVDHAALVKAYNDPSPVIEYASEHYPVHALHRFLAGEASPLPDEQIRHLFLMVRGGGQRAALRIDSFVGSREIVVKSLGLQLSGVRGLMGATIMGNGGVVLILDIPVLLRIGLLDVQSRLQNNVLPGRFAISERVANRDRVLTVMVVDDSITVRKVTSRLLER